ncbi:MAG: bifunctional alpha,alpha-trehalose-phosphate synthase (UDP-forming)/trehalose-phosphatase, partial [Bacteroidota bacterium]|nr:bifunctional alpha,alpha-trehalose-phosphate synthase (UDP-forming)/trehalose-phosphatase [Bacteroidota bacterium]
MSRLLVISNRLPFSLDKSDDEIIVRQSSGGLVSAIKSYFENGKENSGKYSEKIWIGSLEAGEEEWKNAMQNHISCDFGIEPIFIDSKTYNDYYNGFSNSTLWPLFHYFPSLVEYKKEYFDAYVKVNEIFAAKIIETYRSGDVIWIHDYQLLLVPQLVREKLQEAAIGFFLHIPFPSYEIYRLLPTVWKKRLLQGVLGADLIGFHTHDYVQHFIQSAKMILQVENSFNNIQYNNRLIRADLFPIGIDYEKFRQSITDDVVGNISTGLEIRFPGVKFIFSVDRLDYTKGLIYRLKGFEEFLERFPEWRGKVVFILNIIPSRDFISTYIDRRKGIEEKVSAINGKYSTLHWQPLIYRYNHLSFEELCALYQTADVGLITPLRDGMNLVAKEYVASCIDKGVLILSEFTGAASELNEALLVNPTDAEEVANAIENALSMPLVEQRSRISYMQRRLSSYTVINWINDFLNVLSNTKEEQEKQKINVLDTNMINQIINDFGKAKRRCILLDYDGTLAPYRKLPSLAAPGEDLLDLLTQLTNDAANEIIVISGRDTESLTNWLGKLPVTLVAEHGAFIKYRNQDWVQQVSSSNEWKEQIRPLMEL